MVVGLNLASGDPLKRLSISTTGRITISSSGYSQQVIGMLVCLRILKFCFASNILNTHAYELYIGKVERIIKREIDILPNYSYFYVIHLQLKF